MSVGEVLATKTLAKKLTETLPYPLVFTTVTPTGQSLAINPAWETHYFPLDLPGAVNRFLDTFQPKGVIIAETELWPEFLYGCYRRNIPVAVVNGRVSTRSYRGYRMFRTFWRPYFSSLRLVCAQSEEDKRRYEALGASSVQVVGNLKYDVKPKPLDPDTDRLMEHITKDRIAWIAGSTMKGEEELVLRAHREVVRYFNGGLLLLAPRHPERAKEVSMLIDSYGFSWCLRTELTEDFQGEVILLDTLGELAGMYRHFPVAFIGGSLVPKGGHNIIEPAYWGCSIIVGPSMENFQSMVKDFLKKDALTITTPETFSEELIQELQGEHTKGKNAREVIRVNQGALEKSLALLASMLNEK